MDDVSSMDPFMKVIQNHLDDGAGERVFTETCLPDNHPKVASVTLDTSGRNNIQQSGKQMQIHFEIVTPRPMAGAALSCEILDSVHRPLVHLWAYDSERPMCREAGVHRLTCIIPRLRLFMGTYTLRVHFAESERGVKIQTLEDICPFEVVLLKRRESYGWRSGECVYLEDCDWVIQHEQFTKAGDGTVAL